MNDNIVTAIINNDKRMKKIRNAEGWYEKRKIIRKYVVGEVATRKIRLSESEIGMTAARVEIEVEKLI